MGGGLGVIALQTQHFSQVHLPNSPEFGVFLALFLFGGIPTLMLVFTTFVRPRSNED